MSKRPRSEGEEGNGDNLTGSSKKKRTSKDVKPLDPKKFGGKTEEEVCQMLLPDHLAPGLDIVFMGINPGLYSAYMGHHYCNANNHFWPCLLESGLIPRKLGFQDDAEVLKYGIGMSNIVPRTTRTANELSRKEIKEWSKVMIERMRELKPLIICFNGKGIYEIFTGGKCNVGLQEEPLSGTNIVVYVMPSTSGRAATYPKRSDKLKFFNELRELRDRLRRERDGTEVKPTINTTVDDSTQQASISNGQRMSRSDTEEPVRDDTRSLRVPVIVNCSSHKLKGNHSAKDLGTLEKTTAAGEDQVTADEKPTESEPTTSAVRSPYFQQ